MKKLFSLIAVVSLLLGIALCPITAQAAITAYSGTIAILPGNTRSSAPVYNYAWLDNVIVRDDAMAVTSTALTPKPEDYKGSHTLDEFIKEVNTYSAVADIDENTVAAAYREISDALYYLVVAMGMTDELEVMRSFLQDYGIRLPGNEDISDKAAISVIYATIKYDAMYVLYEKELEIPPGATLDGSLVIVLSSLMGTMLPSGIDSLTGMAVNAAKTYVEEFEQLPVSQNPDNEEIFHWVKVITAAANEYRVPLAQYELTTTAQKEYVDYAYYCSMLDTAYDVSVDPIRLIIAAQSEQEDAIARLIIQTMLDERAVEYAFDATTQEIFELAVENGCFALEKEFYSDVLSYELTVAEECERIWFTPFALAGQLEGGSDDRLSILLNDQLVSPAGTASVELNKALRQETVTLSVAYNDGVGRNEKAVYTFIINKDSALNDENTISAENDMVAQIEGFINTIVPKDNETVNNIVDSVIGAVDSNLTTQPDSSALNQGELTTYEANAPQTTTVQSGGYEGYDFKYLDELFAGVYATDASGNIVTTASIFDFTQQEEKTVLEAVGDAVKENPELIVAPTSILTFGSLAGYYFSKKKKRSRIDSFNEEEE